MMTTLETTQNLPVSNQNIGSRPTWLDANLFPFASHFVDVQGQRLHYIDEGTGPVLLFLHATPVWSFVNRHLIIGLRDQFRCIALDFPGFGLSPNEGGYENTLTANSRLVEGFIEALDLSDTTLYLHDASCSIGLGVVVRKPHLIKAAVISNSFAWPLDEYPSIRRFLGVVASPFFGLLIKNFNMFVRYFTNALYREDGIKLSEAEKCAYFGPFGQRSRRSVQAQMFKSILNSRDYLIDLEQRLLAMPEFPVLIAFGDDDATFKAGWMQRMERTFPLHTSVVVKGGHHFPQEYAPDRIIAAVQDWYPKAVGEKSI